jgi:hypothetical protein
MWVMWLFLSMNSTPKCVKRMKKGKKRWESDLLVPLLSSQILSPWHGWQAGTTTLCRSKLYPPARGLWIWKSGKTLEIEMTSEKWHQTWAAEG